MKKYLGLVLGLGVAAMAAAACTGGTTGPANTSPTPTSSSTSIHDVQTGVVATNSSVTLSGVIVTGISTGGAHLAFWAQDQGGGKYSGIYFYDKNGVVDPGIAIGDTASITGTVVNYYGDMEINVSSYSRTNTGATPTVDTVPVTDLDDTSSSQSRAWLGCLINVTGAKVTTVGLGYGDFGIGSSFGTPQYPLHVGAFLNDSFENAVVGQSLSTLIGIVDFNYDYELYPRSSTDITFSGTNAPVTEASLSAINSAANGGTLVPGQLVSLTGAIYVTGTSGYLNPKTNKYRVNFWAQDGLTSTSGTGMEFDDSFYQNPTGLAAGKKITNTNPLVGKLIQRTSGNKTQGWTIEFGFSDHPFNSSVGAGGTLVPATVTFASFNGSSPAISAYEGELVKINTSSSVCVAVDSYKEFPIADSSNAGNCAAGSEAWVTDNAFSPYPANGWSQIPAANPGSTAFTSVTGVVTHGYYWFVNPRNMADLP